MISALKIRSCISSLLSYLILKKPVKCELSQCTFSVNENKPNTLTYTSISIDKVHKSWACWVNLLLTAIIGPAGRVRNSAYAVCLDGVDVTWKQLLNIGTGVVKKSYVKSLGMG